MVVVQDTLPGTEYHTIGEDFGPIDVDCDEPLHRLVGRCGYSDHTVDPRVYDSGLTPVHRGVVRYVPRFVGFDERVRTERAIKVLTRDGLILADAWVSFGLEAKKPGNPYRFVALNAAMMVGVIPWTLNFTHRSNNGHSPGPRSVVFTRTDGTRWSVGESFLVCEIVR